MKKSSQKSPFRIREETPRAMLNDRKQPVLVCPFCDPPHVISLDKVSPCGTALKVTAVQTLFRAKYEKSMVCSKCGQGNGEMVMVGKSFVHFPDCNPRINIVTEMPPVNKYAEAVSRLPTFLRRGVEKFTGRAQPVEEIGADGKQTGNVLGYFFLKRTHA